MQAHLDIQSLESVKRWLAGWMEAELGLDHREIDPAQAFLSYGMDSMHAMMLVGDLEGGIGMRLPPTLVWDYPTIQDLAGHVVGLAAAPRSPGGPADTRSGQAIPNSQPDAKTILAQLDGMSEEDIDLLLNQYTSDNAEIRG